ncbi:SMC-Scp complex subunit ScpB [Escherichia coli]
MLLAELRKDYETRGVELKEVASGWRFQARQEYAEELSRLWSERAPRYTNRIKH